jgi:hypothetical protein
MVFHRLIALDFRPSIVTPTPTLRRPQRREERREAAPAEMGCEVPLGPLGWVGSVRLKRKQNSLDWFKVTSEPETMVFTIKKIGLMVIYWWFNRRSIG